MITFGKRGGQPQCTVEVVQFPTTTVDTVKRGEALANIEGNLINQFQKISKAAAIYAKSLLGGVHRASEAECRCDHITQKHDGAIPAAEELRHDHAEGKLVVQMPRFGHLSSYFLWHCSWPFRGEHSASLTLSENAQYLFHEQCCGEIRGVLVELC